MSLESQKLILVKQNQENYEKMELRFSPNDIISPIESLTGLIELLDYASLNDRLTLATNELEFVVFQDKILGEIRLFTFAPPYNRLNDGGPIARVGKEFGVDTQTIDDFMSGDLKKTDIGWVVERIFDRGGQGFGEYLNILRLHGCRVK